MAAEKNTIGTDPNANPLGTVYFTGHIDTLILAAGVAESYTVPSGTQTLIIKADSEGVHVRKGGTAAIASADVPDGTGSGLIINGAAWMVRGGEVFSFICATAAEVSIYVYN